MHGKWRNKTKTLFWYEKTKKQTHELTDILNIKIQLKGNIYYVPGWGKYQSWSRNFIKKPFLKFYQIKLISKILLLSEEDNWAEFCGLVNIQTNKQQPATARANSTGLTSMSVHVVYTWIQLSILCHRLNRKYIISESWTKEIESEGAQIKHLFEIWGASFKKQWDPYNPDIHLEGLDHSWSQGKTG